MQDDPMTTSASLSHPSPLPPLVSAPQASRTTPPAPTRPASPDQWLRDYQRDDRRLEFLLRGIVAVALGLALLSLATLMTP